MSYVDYIAGRAIADKEYPFYAIIMAAMRRADTENLQKLQEAFPGTFKELRTRYNSPGGYLPGEQAQMKRVTENGCS